MTYAQMGMAALLPGMQYMLERMQRELDDMRGQLALMQNGADVAGGAREPGRPRKLAGLVPMVGLTPGTPERRGAHSLNESIYRRARKAAGARSNWPATAEGRSAEMKRRQAVTRDRRASLAAQEAKAAKSQAISELRRKMWAKKTKEEKAEWRAKMVASKKRAEKARAAA